MSSMSLAAGRSHDPTYCSGGVHDSMTNHEVDDVDDVGNDDVSYYCNYLCYHCYFRNHLLDSASVMRR